MKIYLTVEELLAIHHKLILEFGGSHGLRDKGGLESAQMRPQTGYYQDIIEQAAALMESLAINHPFVDGNKRMAFFATDTFLRLNGFYIDCDNDKAYAFFIKLFETNSFRFENLAKWLKNNVRSL
jgi:death-on-curing protein